MRILVAPIIFLVVLFLYQVPIKSNSFILDDDIAISYNPAVVSTDITALFNTFNTRFIPGISFALNHWLAGADPTWYRLTNLAIHIGNSILVYLLICGLMPSKRLIALLVTILFLFHPVNTEPVNYITQRFVLMGSFFYLSTVILYMRKSHWAVLTAVMAMFCKEFTVTLPLMLLMYDFYFSKVNWKRLIPFFLVALIVPLMLLRTPKELVPVSAIASIQSTDGKYSLDITKARQGYDRKDYFLTQLRVICTYIKLLFFPVNQVFNYDYPMSKGFSGKTLVGGIFLLSLIAISFCLYSTNKLLSFGIMWFFLALSIESSFIPIGHVIAEYRVYLASVGFVLTLLAMTTMVDLKVGQTLLVLFIVVFAFLTYQRNKVWESDITLWSDTAKKAPRNPRVYGGLGNAYLNVGDVNQAIIEYEKSIEVSPNDPEGYVFMGNFYEYIGRSEKSEFYFDKAIALKPSANAYINRACFYLRIGNPVRAWEDYNKTVMLLNNDVDARFKYVFNEVCRG